MLFDLVFAVTTGLTMTYLHISPLPLPASLESATSSTLLGLCRWSSVEACVFRRLSNVSAQDNDCRCNKMA